MGTLDPEILIWCEKYDCVLVTDNRSTMPVHLAEHVNDGHHVPGIFLLNPNMSIGDTIEQKAVAFSLFQGGVKTAASQGLAITFHSLFTH
jgi:hypothetical protein